MTITLERKVAEVHANFSRLQQILPTVIDEHRGQYALIRHGKIISYHQEPLAAQIAGNLTYDDKEFSIQEITDRNEDLGWYSHVDDQR